MTDLGEEVLLGWARDAGGGAQRFTGESIYGRAGAWAMDRLTRGIPVVITYHYTFKGNHLTSELAMVPMGSAPFARLRPADMVDELRSGLVLLGYASIEDG